MKTFLVHQVKNTCFGDANLDGEFNSTDLVIVPEDSNNRLVQRVALITMRDNITEVSSNS